jgi:hypothetical protein
VSISLDHVKAKDVLFSQAESAKCGDLSQTVIEWRDRVSKLGELCPHGKSSTVIAALGTALLAKSTDYRVDVYSLLDRGEAEDSYSARSLADNVWARHRAELDIDLGANGANPLNNTPFIGKTRIDEITGVRNRDGWKYFVKCMEAAKAIVSSEIAAEALRGFILARSRSLLPPIDVPHELGDHLTQSAVISLIDGFVSEDSDGGRRAQAAVAAMLDASFGPENVIVGVINDPDRRAPLDVSVTRDGEAFTLAVEVKDKPISDYHVRSSIEKTVKDHNLRNLAFVAVGKQQDVVDFDAVVLWGAMHGIKVTVFLDWQSLYLACKCFAPAHLHSHEGCVFRRVIVRADELGVSRNAIERLRVTEIKSNAANDG